MQLGEMQHFNTMPLSEMQPGKMKFGEMQLSRNSSIISNITYAFSLKHRNNDLENRVEVFNPISFHKLPSIGIPTKTKRKISCVRM